MNIEIKHRWTNACLWSGDADNMRDAVVKAIADDADLIGADLIGANLRGANLSGANLPDGYRIARIDFGGWSICVTPEKTSIGCQTHPNSDWLAWEPDDEQIVRMAHGASEFWARHKEAVRAVIRDVMGAN